MAQIKDSTKKKKLKSSCFLGCFGFSREASKEKQSSDDKAPKRRQWFSSARKKRSTNQTGLIDVMGKEIQMLKPGKKVSPIRAFSANHIQISEMKGPVSDQVVPKTNKKRYDNAQEIILENRKSLSKLEMQKGLTSATKSTDRRTLSHPISRDDKKTAKLLSQSVSLPPPKGKKTAVNGGGDQPITEKNKSEGKFDSLVGMSIILITLLIMLFWGKVCAILCTSAWFYFVPRFTTRNEPNVTTTNDSNTREIDINSEEYKKKVVLEGLLQRNHRNSVGIM